MIRCCGTDVTASTMPVLIYCWILLITRTQQIVNGRTNWFDDIQQQQQQVAVVAAAAPLGWNAFYDRAKCPCCTEWCEFHQLDGLLSCREVSGWPDYPSECVVHSLEVIGGLFESTTELDVFQVFKQK